MHFEHSLKTQLPIDLVYKTLRDELPNLTKYMPNIDRVELIERRESENDVYTIYKWYAKNILQSFLAQFIKLNDIAWLDKGRWSKNGYVCDWTYEPFILQGHVNAKGQTICANDGMFTSITYKGDVYVNLDQYPFIVIVPGMIREKLVEEFLSLVASLIELNFVALIKGLEQYINSKTQ